MQQLMQQIIQWSRLLLWGHLVGRISYPILYVKAFIQFFTLQYRLSFHISMSCQLSAPEHRLNTWCKWWVKFSFALRSNSVHSWAQKIFERQLSTDTDANTQHIVSWQGHFSVQYLRKLALRFVCTRLLVTFCGLEVYRSAIDWYEPLFILWRSAHYLWE